ncbi:MAG: hypothetical protein NDJ92_02010 [Thermoanaerobaculia bacterium]|nr:hypothetical protein [Thermoanaerobaculia bacterium]
MESLTVRQRLRPLRFCFVIRPDDQDGFLRAAALNTVLWGGIYNPIVPCSPNLGGYLEEFDPDQIVNCSGEALPDPISAAYEFRIHNEDALLEAPTIGIGAYRRRLTLGVGIEPVLRHLSETQLRDATVPSRLAVPTDVPQEWTLYAGATFGTFANLPDLGGDIVGLYRALTRSTNVPIDPAAEFDVRRWRFPIDVTGYGIRRFNAIANMSSHVVYVGDHQSVDDIAGFWNIRATGRDVWFVPVAQYEHHRAMLAHLIERGRYAINPHIENRADIQRGPSVPEDSFKTVADWIHAQGVGPSSIRSWQPRFGSSMDHYVGDIHVADIEGSRGDDIVILADGRLTPIKLVDPPYLDDDDSTDHEWAVELQISNPYIANDWMCQLPRARGVGLLAQRLVLGGRNETRLGRNGLVVTANHVRSTAHAIPLPTTDVFQAMLEAATGLQVTPSQPGIYAEQIIRKMGSLAFDCRAFKIRGVRDVLDTLSRGSTLTRGNMRETVISTTQDAYGQNWRPDLYEHLCIARGQQVPDFTPIFEDLLAKRMIRPGLYFTCRNCRKKDWYHVSEFTEEYTCRYCFERQRVPFGSRAEWQYRADGLFQVDRSAQGSIATIVALWRLNEVEHGAHGRYCTGLNFTKPGGIVELEIDYAYLQMDWFSSAYELVLGEAKNFSDYDEPAVTKLKTLADKFERKPYLAVATLKDSFGGAEKALLREAVSKGYRVIPLTRLELDPYYLHERFAGTRHKYATRFCDLAEACVAVNLG